MSEDKPENAPVDKKEDKPTYVIPKGKKHYHVTNNGKKVLAAKRAKIIEMAIEDKPVAAIARETGCNKSTIKKLISEFQPVFKKLGKVTEYRSVKQDILAAAQIQALESAFSGSKLNRSSFIQTVRGFEILNKAERLEAGLSTENHASRVITQTLAPELLESDVIEVEE